VGFLDRFLAPPANATPTERHNFRVAYRESALIGFIAAGGTFLPVFVARLGGSVLAVSMITALPSLTGVILAIPLGGLMQSRRNIIPWYSRGRLGSQAGYLAIAIAAFLLPPDLVLPGILAIWAVVTLFSVVTSVSFSVVMDATAGSTSRYELMSRRWSIMGLLQAVGLVFVGQALGWLTFPSNYQLVFAALGVIAFACYRYSSAIRVPDHVPRPPRGAASRFAPAREAIARVRTEPPFVAFLGRHLVFAIGTSIAVPLVPLYYVRVMNAPDAWIGIIGTTQALTLLVGYTLWRRVSGRRGAAFVTTWATIGMAIAPAALALTHDVVVAAAVAGVGAIFTAGVNLALFDRMMSIVPKDYAVVFTSVDTWITYVAGIAGPLIAAALADAVGISAALVVAAVVTLGGAVLFALDRGAAHQAVGAAPSGAGSRRAPEVRPAEGRAAR
jgi:hypothetical protein